MPSASPGVGTDSDPVAMTTFRYQALTVIGRMSIVLCSSVYRRFHFLEVGTATGAEQAPILLYFNFFEPQAPILSMC